jgi:hypothetical protein
VEELCQLTKANSIEGCKKASCGINYTWARNLKKTIGMEVGAVTFFDSKQVRRVQINKDKEIVKRIMKTKKEAFPNFEQDLRDHKKAVEVRDNAEILDEKKQLKEQEEAARAIK